jgi:hypothetical protein
MTDRPVRTLVTVFGADAAALALGAGTALRATPHAPAPGDPPRGHTSVARRAARATHGRSGSAGRPVAGTPRPLAPRPARRLGGRGRRTLLRLPPVQFPGLPPHGPLQRGRAAPGPLRSGPVAPPVPPRASECARAPACAAVMCEVQAPSANVVHAAANVVVLGLAPVRANAAQLAGTAGHAAQAQGSVAPSTQAECTPRKAPRGRGGGAVGPGTKPHGPMRGGVAPEWQT